MARARKAYTPEFKLQAVAMVTDQKLSVAEVARRLDVGENLLRTWKKAFEERGNDAFPGHGHPRPGAGGDLRVPGGVLQPRPPSLLPGVHVPGRV